jgi:hypothetical protein
MADWRLWGACALAILVGASPCSGASARLLSGHVPAAAAKLTALSRVAPTNRLRLAIGLPLRNQAELTHLIGRISDPASPYYRQYLSPDLFAARFGPADKDYERVRKFAQSQGLSIRGTHPNRMLLDVEGSAAAIESAFNLRLNLYRHPRESRTFFAPDREPSVDPSLPVLHINGLDNYQRPKPQLVSLATNWPRGQGGTGPNDSYRGYDFRNLYLPGVAAIGAGQSVGLLQFDGYYPSDIALYVSYCGLPGVTLTNVLLDGFDGAPVVESYNAEVSLDIEMALSMAPGLSRVIVYSGGPSGFANDILNRMATDNLAKQLSCSWAWWPPDATTDQIFLQFAAQGQTFFCASGDSDAYTGSILVPSDSPYITVVGGTVLNTTNAAWGGEKVWNWNNNAGSGGGISPTYPIPSWQQGIDMSACHGSFTMRNIPDVSLIADGVWVVYNKGLSGMFGGTSISAPLWAGLMALVNEQAAAVGRAPAGFINPALYALGKSSSSSNFFHDITLGNNTNTLSPTNYFAVAGYDLCTGWGTPAGTNLLGALAVPDPLLIAPAASLMVTTRVGQASSPGCLTLWLTNQGGADLVWTATNTAAWLSLSPAGGRVAPGGGASISVCVNSKAWGFVSGVYEDTVTIQNVSAGFSQARTVDLLVQPLNDQCANAIVLSGVHASYSEFTGTATSDGDPAPACFKEFGRGVWFQYTPAFDGFLHVYSVGSDYDSALAFYSGSCGNLALLACDDDSGGNYTSSLTNLVYAGTTYYILAGGYAAASGNLVLQVDGVNGAAPDIATQPVDQAVTEGGTLTFSVEASGTGPLSYSWWRNGTPVPGATNTVYSTPALKLSDAGSQFGCLVSNAFGAVSSRGAVAHVYSLPRTFASTNPITINDNSPASPYPSVISIGNQTGTVAAATATLHGFAHTFPADVSALLVGPQGQRVLLLAHDGNGQPVTNLTLAFSDAASNSLSWEASLFSGLFKPGMEWMTNDFPLPAPAQPYGTNLSVFYGARPNGNWSLYVQDDALSDAGRLAGGWSLEIAFEPVSSVPAFVAGSLKSLPGGQFQFGIAGDYGASYDLQVSTDLKNWKWLKALSMTNDVSVFVDTNTNLTRRFYRLRHAVGE